MSEPLQVMAGVLLDGDGRVLLAQRPPGKHLAGSWEFPGGKRETGETPPAALARELREELGIELDPAGVSPLIRVPWLYGERALLLDAWRVAGWLGTPESLEGQALKWCLPTQVDPRVLAPADRPILQALRLPERYPITPAEVSPQAAELWSSRLLEAIASGARLLQLRLPLWPQARVRELAAALLPQARRHGAQLLLNADIEGARRLGEGVGVQLKQGQLAALGERPLPWHQPVGASCHDAAGLALARRIEADFATLSPVAATATHPQTRPLGWATFEALVDAAALPVYALGGMQPQDVARARMHGAQGVSGIRGFWPAAAP